MEPADLDEIQQALCGGDARAWASLHDERTLAPSGGPRGDGMFIQEERYFRAYASYCGRFADEYRKQGKGISMVMPQNEFNSVQVFPSCT